MNKEEMLYAYYLAQKESDSETLEIATHCSKIISDKDTYETDCYSIPKHKIGKILEGTVYLLEDNKEMAKDIFRDHFDKQIQYYQAELESLQHIVDILQSRMEMLDNENDYER